MGYAIRTPAIDRQRPIATNVKFKRDSSVMTGCQTPMPMALLTRQKKLEATRDVNNANNVNNEG